MSANEIAMPEISGGANPVPETLKVETELPATPGS